MSTTIPASAPHRVRGALAAPLSPGSYTLVVSGVADRQGNVLDIADISFSFFVPDTPAPRDVVVTEILYAPPTSSNEFIELYNRSDKTFDLGALRIADAQRDFNALAPPLTPLSPGERVVLVRDTATFTRAFPSVDYFAPPGWEALNNGGDTVRLRHAPSGTEVDAVPYAPSWGGSNGRSLERIDPHGPSDHPSNFASSRAAAGATPGARNSRYARDTAPPHPTFAEQTDSTTAEIVFGEPVQPESITPDAFDLGAISVTESRLRADSIARLSLSGSPTTSSVVVTGVRDLVGNQLPRTTLPFARQPTPGALVVNEILFDARSDPFDDRPNQVEYVELFSLADHPLTLNGLVLTDRPTERGNADTIRAGRRRVLFPGRFAVVAAAPAGATRAEHSQLIRAFPEAPLSSDSVAYLPVDANQLGLRNDGDLVRVHRRDKTIVADVAYVPDWHAAGLAETKGTALARISPTADANAPDNWTSSTAPAGG
ncbi:MAG: lamin tail domain-containing protein, partial [Salinibacter sp.]